MILDSGAPPMPALFIMMSSQPYVETAALTALSTSDSLVTSQWTNVAGDSKSLQTSRANSSWMSAITTLAPWRENNRAVASPMPLAPPVIRATFPSSLHH